MAGIQRYEFGDTRAQSQMRAAMRDPEGRASARAVWAAMPVAQRAHLWVEAFGGLLGVALVDAAHGWDTLTADQRRRLGYVARREAGALV